GANGRLYRGTPCTLRPVTRRKLHACLVFLPRVAPRAMAVAARVRRMVAAAAARGVDVVAARSARARRPLFSHRPGVEVRNWRVCGRQPVYPCVPAVIARRPLRD